MADQAPAEDLRRITEVIARHHDGIAVAVLLRELPDISRRTMNRRLAMLIRQGVVKRRGATRRVLYFLARGMESSRQDASASTELATPGAAVELELSAAARKILDYVSRPASGRKPVGYRCRFLELYKPNRTAYLPDSTRAHLHRIGRPIDGHRAAGTFARDILSRLLIDLSWSSSRLEGNTYTRLDTQRLIEFGQAAEGKDATETQMILNHKAAIEMLVDDQDDIGINRFTLLNLHALLSEDLMADPEASGRLRRRPVEVGKSVYVPTALPQVIDAQLDILVNKAAAIRDPFEQAFFMMVHVPYLQPFEDVNKRVSRLAANVPLIQRNLCPLSFVDVPERAYVLGTLGVYEMTRVELLRDVFVWAYRRSCQRYVVVRDSVVEPDLFRMKHRTALSEVIGDIVRAGMQPTDGQIERRAKRLVESGSLGRFVALTKAEFCRLYEGNIARYRIRLGEYRAWRERTGQRENKGP